MFFMGNHIFYKYKLPPVNIYIQNSLYYSLDSNNQYMNYGKYCILTDQVLSRHH